VVFRQDIGGSSLAIARRLIGSQLEPPAVVGGPGATAPAIAMDERGAGQSVVANADGTIMGSQLDHDAFAPPAPLGGGDGPQVATSERQDMAAAWHVGPGQVTGLYRHEKALGPPTLLSTAGFGVVPAGQLQIGGDRLGDMVVAMLQGDAGAHHVTAAVYDRPPGRPLIYRSSGIQKRERPVLRFRPALDLWGAPTYELMIGRRLIAASQTATKVRAAASVSQGRHRVRLVQVDRRGQTGVSRPRIIRVDGTPPRLRVKVRGKRRRGAILRITVRASDGKGTGLRYVEINFGDRTRRVRAKRALHRYRAGSFTLTVKAVDKIGNVALRKVKLRIKK